MEPIYQQDFEITDLYVDCFGRLLPSKLLYIMQEVAGQHFSRLSEGNCSLEVSPYYTSTITGLERVADHIVNVGYSICNPVGDDKDDE